MISSHNYIKKQITYVKAQINRLRTHVATQIVQASQVQEVGIPSGTIMPYLGTNTIAGYLVCDGSAYNVDDYPTLYAILMTIDETIRTTWGDADWETTFNVPDLRGLYLKGDDTMIGILQDEGLPNITGTIRGDGYRGQNSIFWYSNGGALYTGREYPGGSLAQYSASGGTANNASLVGIDASRSSAIYGRSEHVTPKNIAVQYIIKT